MGTHTRMDLSGAWAPLRVGNNLLERSAFSQPKNLSSAQSQIDGLVDRFVERATDWRLLAAFTAGAAAYPLGRLGVFSSPIKSLGSLPFKALSIAAGLSAEVSAFEISHRALESLNPPNPPLTKGGEGRFSNLWRWNGNDGLRQGLFQSFVGFGALKGLGHWGRTENIVVQHLLQDAGMVLSHRATAALGLTPAVPSSLAEQFVEAEALNLQMLGGGALLHSMAPGLSAWQRSLNISIPSEGPSFLSVAKTLRAEEALATAPSSAPAAPREEKPLPWLLSSSLGGDSLPIVLGGKTELLKFLNQIVEKDLGKKFASETPLLELWVQAIEHSPLLYEENKALPIQALRSDFEWVAKATPESDYSIYQQAMGKLIFAARHWAHYEKYGREKLFLQNLVGLYNPLALRLGPRGTQYWYAAESGGKSPGPTDYSSRAEPIWNELTDQLTWASLAMRQLQTREDFLTHRVDENLVNQIWIYQLLHFIEGVGGRVEFKDASCLVESFNPSALPLDDLPLTQALELLRREGLNTESEQVIEWVVPYYEVMFGEQQSVALNAPLSSLLRDIQYNLKGSVRFAELGDSDLKLRIPTPSLLQRLLQTVHGEQAPLLYYVNGEIPRDEMVRLREIGVSAVGITRDPVILNDVQAFVPPWGFFFHDIFHAHSMAPYSEGLRHFAAALYRHVTGGGLPLSDIREEHLRRLVDLEPKPEKYLRFTLEHLHDIKWLADFNWRLKFQGLDDRLRFVQDYQNSLNLFLPADVETGLLKAQFRQELSRVERKLLRTQRLNRLLNLFDGSGRKQSR